MRTKLVVSVSPQGAPTYCSVSRASGYPVLDDLICETFIHSAKFQPAHDDHGNPVAGIYDFVRIWEAFDTAIDASTSKAAGPRQGSDSSNWVTAYDLPKGVLRPDEIVVSDIIISVSSAGKVIDCQTVDSSELPKLDDYACRLVKARGHYSPARDAAGNRTDGVDWMRVRWQALKN